MALRKKRNLKRLNFEDIVIDTINYVILIAIFIVTLYPFYFILVMSFNNGQDAMRGGIYFWPRVFTIENYKSFLGDSSWITAIGVTTARTIIGTFLTVLFTCLVAYGLSFKDLVFRKVYMLLIIISMYFSGGLIPYYIVLQNLNLLNHFSVYIIPGLLSSFFVLVAISFFQEIPKELRESAMMEGANELKIFAKLIFPVSMPLMATLALFTGVGHWNSWFDSAFFVHDKGLRTLGYLLVETINKSQARSASANAQIVNTTTTLSIQMTAMVISIAPIICVYPFLQKYFVKGIMIGSVKG